MKAVIIVLVVVGGLFIAMMVVGARQNGKQQAPADASGRQSFAQSFDPETSGMAGIGRLIAPFSPKLKLPRSAFVFGFAGISQGVPASSDQFRQASFHVQQGCVAQGSGGAANCSAVQIFYQSVGGEGRDLQLDQQRWQGTRNDPTTGSLVILMHGGTLNFRCVGMPSCTVLLQ
jgi:hypothetical protein